MNVCNKKAHYSATGLLTEAVLVRIGWVLGPWWGGGAGDFLELTPLLPYRVGSAMCPKGPKTSDHPITFFCMTSIRRHGQLSSH